MSNTRRNMIYVDANVFVHAILDPEERQPGKSAGIVMKQISTGDMHAMTSFLTWDELLWALKRYLDYKLAIEECKKFLEFPNLVFTKVDETIINLAQDIVERYNLKPRDSIHVATAVSNGIKEIISDDADFDAVKEIKRIPIEKFR